MKQFRSAIALAVLLAVLGGVAYWDEWQTKKDEASEKQKNVFLEFNKDAVAKILYRTRIDGKDLNVELEKSEGNWNLTSPIRFPADNAAVNNLLQTLSDYKYEKVVAESSDQWGQYGVKEPSRLIRLDLPEGKSITAYIGEKAPVGFSVYVRNSESDKTYIGGQHLYTATEKKLSDFRDKTLSKLSAANIIGLDVAGKKTRIRVERKSKDDKFVGVKPTPFTADQDTIEDLISTIRNEKVQDFIDHPDSSMQRLFNPQNRLFTFEFEQVDGKKFELFLAEKDGKLYAAYDPKTVIFVLDPEFKKKIDKEPDSFKDRTVFKLNASDIKEVEIDGDEFVREGAEWKKKGDADGPSKNHIQSLLVDMEFAKAEKVLDKATAEKTLANKAPVHRLHLKSNDDKKAEVVVDVWPVEREEFFIVRISEDPKYYKIAKSHLSNLSEKTTDPAEPGGLSKMTQDMDLGDPGDESLSN